MPIAGSRRLSGPRATGQPIPPRGAAGLHRAGRGGATGRCDAPRRRRNRIPAAGLRSPPSLPGYFCRAWPVPQHALTVPTELGPLDPVAKCRMSPILWRPHVQSDMRPGGWTPSPLHRCCCGQVPTLQSQRAAQAANHSDVRGDVARGRLRAGWIPRFANPLQ